MSSYKIFAIILIIAGSMAIVYGGFSFVSDTHEMNIGSMHFSFNEHETVSIPLWAGIGSVITGVLLFVFGKRIR